MSFRRPGFQAKSKQTAPDIYSLCSSLSTISPIYDYTGNGLNIHWAIVWIWSDPITCLFESHFNRSCVPQFAEFVFSALQSGEYYIWRLLLFCLIYKGTMACLRAVRPSWDKVPFVLWVPAVFGSARLIIPQDPMWGQANRCCCASSFSKRGPREESTFLFSAK